MSRRSKNNMPFTPFHFGPAAFIKSVERRFSFTVFVFSQIVMDSEPLYFMLHRDWPAHRLFHTFAGCHIPILITLLVGKPLCEAVLKIWNSWIGSKKSAKISWSAALVSAFAGAYSHVFLDGMMHRDMHPFFPVTAQNPLLGLISSPAIHIFCVFTGLAGLIIFVRKMP